MPFVTPSIPQSRERHFLADTAVVILLGSMFVVAAGLLAISGYRSKDRLNLLTEAEARAKTAEEKAFAEFFNRQLVGCQQQVKNFERRFEFTPAAIRAANREELGQCVKETIQAIQILRSPTATEATLARLYPAAH